MIQKTKKTARSQFQIRLKIMKKTCNQHIKLFEIHFAIKNILVPLEDESASSTVTKGKTWGPSSMSQHQRERGFLPAFQPERLHSLVKSAPNLDNKSRSSSTSASTENILLGNNSDFCDKLSNVKSTTSINSHHYTNTNYHSIAYERDLTKRNENIAIESNLNSTPVSSHEYSTESVETYESDDSSEHSVSIGCFSFVGTSSTSDNKKLKNRYKKLSKVSNDFDNNQFLSSLNSMTSTEINKDKKTKISNSRKNSTDQKKKIQFEELTTPKAQFNVDLMFYKRLEQSLVGSHELSDQDIIYLRTKPKNKLAMRLQKSLDAIDSYDLDNRPEKVYSKSIDDLSTDSEYQWHRGGSHSQFTWDCFLKNGNNSNSNNKCNTNQEKE